jgi:ABC-type nitrate/sulfonate/bicarbonate transport system substrate-binding protein
MAALATTDGLIRAHPERAAGAVRALVAAQHALAANPGIAAEVAAKLFPREASHIVDLVRRDIAFYQAHLWPEFVAGMNRFARARGILDADVPYEAVVATSFSALWRPEGRPASAATGRQGGA